MVDVKKVSDRVMTLAVVVFEEDVLRLICGMLRKVEEILKKNSPLCRAEMRVGYAFCR